MKDIKLASLAATLLLICYVTYLLLTTARVQFNAGYTEGYNKGINQVRSEDIKELVTLRQVMQNYPSSIIIIDCNRQKLIHHEIRKRKKIGNFRVSDAIYYTGECK